MRKVRASRASAPASAGQPGGVGASERPRLESPDLLVATGLSQDQLDELFVAALVKGGAFAARINSIRRGDEEGSIELHPEVHLPSSTEERSALDFDPWTASIEVALTHGFHSPEHSAWVAARIVDQNRSGIENDGVKLLLAISFLMNHRLKPPEWLARAYLGRMTPFERLEHRTLDEAFGFEPPNERQFGAQKRVGRQMVEAVHKALHEAVLDDSERPLDASLFEEVGDSFDIGKTLCQEIYAKAIKQYGLQDLAELKALLKSVKSTRRM